MNRKGFASLLGLMLALVIIFFIGYKAYNNYQKSSNKKSQGVEIQQPKGYYESRVDTFLDTKEKIKDINKMTLEREDQSFDSSQEGR
jgi:hypothetical protein